METAELPMANCLKATNTCNFHAVHKLFPVWLSISLWSYLYYQDKRKGYSEQGEEIRKFWIHMQQKAHLRQDFSFLHCTSYVSSINVNHCGNGHTQSIVTEPIAELFEVYTLLVFPSAFGLLSLMHASFFLHCILCLHFIEMKAAYVPQIA